MLPRFPRIATAFLEIHEQVDKMGFPKQEAQPIADKLALALRLLQPQPVGIGSMRWFVVDQPFRPMGWMSGGPTLLLSHSFAGAPYIFNHIDAEELKALWPKTSRKISGDLETPVTRFNDSYSEN